MKATRINHVSVRALDIAESVRFYSELFGATPVATSELRRHPRLAAAGRLADPYLPARRGLGP